MRWINCGHEYDKKASRLIEQFRHTVYIYGKGRRGESVYNLLAPLCPKLVFIDNDIKKQSKGEKGIKVISFLEYLESNPGFMICAVGKKYINEIKKQIEEAELKEEEYCFYDDFCNIVFPLLQLYINNWLYLDVVQLSLTERCTLRCRKCAHGCNYVKRNMPDMSFVEARESVDALFSVADYVNMVCLIGGEPLLYKDLERVLFYIAKNYRDRIGELTITTNGTVLPTEDLLTRCAELDVHMLVSNYGKSLPQLREKYVVLCDKLKKRGVTYTLYQEDTQWMDYGFDHVDRGFQEEELMVVFDKCPTPCREIRGNRFYYCIQARATRENAGFMDCEDDYLRLDKLPEDRKKHILFEYDKGYSEKGYLDMCNYCYGAEAEKHPIRAAEQEG